MTLMISYKKILLVVLAALFVAGAFAVDAYAADRGGISSRDRTSARTSDPAPEPEPEQEEPTHNNNPSGNSGGLPAQAGGIVTTTDGSVSTGGNQGGHVETGDQHVEVHEVNVGPVNDSEPEEEEEEEEVVQEPEPEPEPQCDGRAARGCVAPSASRSR